MTTFPSAERWLWISIVCNIIYLCFELAFNARLVENATNLDASQVEILELFGRTLAGVGFLLIVFRFLPKEKITALEHWRWKMAGILFAAFLVMFYGQRMYIDALVDGSSAEDRYNAQSLLLLKRALVANAVEIEGVDYDEDDIDSAQTQTFIATLGFLVFHSDQGIQSVRNNIDTIFTAFAKQEADKVVEQYYADYRAAKVDIDARYQTLLSEMPDIKAMAAQLELDFERFYQTRKKCLKQSYDVAKRQCEAKVDQVYNDAILAKTGVAIPWQTWCGKTPDTKRFVVRANRLTEEKIKGRLLCENRTAAILLPILKQVIELPDLSTKAQFYKSHDVQLAIHQAMNISGNDYIPVDLSLHEFTKHILMPLFEARLAQEKAALNVPVAIFADGQQQEAEGKAYVRMVVVLPIAMGFSLFFALLNAASLISTYIGIKHKDNDKARKLKLFLPPAVIIFPLLISSGISATSAFQHFVDQSKASLGLGRYAVHWLMGVQPLISPIGTMCTWVTPQDTLDGIFGWFVSDPKAEDHVKENDVIADGDPDDIPRCGTNLIAHRALGGQGMENSLTAIKHSLTTGYNAIEIDIMRLATGEWVLHHDPILKRCTVDPSNSRKVVTSMASYEWELVKYQTNSAQCGAHTDIEKTPPLLARALELLSATLQPGQKVIFEIKDDPLGNRYSCDDLNDLQQQVASVLPHDRYQFAAMLKHDLRCLVYNDPKANLAFISPLHSDSVRHAYQGKLGWATNKVVQYGEKEVAPSGLQVMNSTLSIDSLNQVKNIIGQKGQFFIDYRHIEYSPELQKALKDSHLDWASYDLLDNNGHRQFIQKHSGLVKSVLVEGQYLNTCQQVGGQ